MLVLKKKRRACAAKPHLRTEGSDGWSWNKTHTMRLAAQYQQTMLHSCCIALVLLRMLFKHLRVACAVVCSRGSKKSSLARWRHDHEPLTQMINILSEIRQEESGKMKSASGAN
jgi:hypothetical protein